MTAEELAAIRARCEAHVAVGEAPPQLPRDGALDEVWVEVARLLRCADDAIALLAEVDRLRALVRLEVSVMTIDPRRAAALPTRVRNAMRRARVDSVEALLEASDADLLRLRNFGRKSMVVLDEWLGSLGVARQRTGWDRGVREPERHWRTHGRA